jgi:nucleotide-binding universal stress UspA family protein
MSGGEPVSDSVPHGAVVVAVDGSEASDRAVAWGARYASLEDLPLVIAHTFGEPGAPHAAGWPQFDSAVTFAAIYEQLREGGQAVVDTAAATVAESYPTVSVSTVLEDGDPRHLLLRLAEDASLVVMGSRGRGPFRSLLLGSVTSTVAGRAHCPVVVMPLGGPGEGEPVRGTS